MLPGRSAGPTIDEGMAGLPKVDRETSVSQYLGTIIAALHDSEINGSVTWVHDRLWGVALGDPMSGVVAEGRVSSPNEAADWLRSHAVRRYPHSNFARHFLRSDR